MPTREEVYKAIDGERDYQESFVKDKFNNPKYPHPVDAEVLMVTRYAARAGDAWTDNKGDEAALDILRKIAAMCVRAMENHGVVERK